MSSTAHQLAPGPTGHVPLGLRVIDRKNELEDALADVEARDTLERQAIETALSTLYSLITGDLVRPPDVVARRLSAWLERNKHLAVAITERQCAEHAERERRRT